MDERERIENTPPPLKGWRQIVWKLHYDPLASQNSFHECRARFKGFSGPVGAGKSMALCVEAFRLATMNPGCQGLLGAPTYRMLRDVTQFAFVRLLEDTGVHFEFNKSDNVIRIVDLDAEIMLRSLDDPDRLRGTNLAWFGIDELTFTTEDSWTRLEARLREPKAKELCGFGVWTPNGHDWVYRRFIKSPVPGYACIRAKAHENRFILNANPEFYSHLQNSYDPRFYRQEVLGEYLNILQGRVYECFDRERNVGPAEYDPREPLYWSFDFNVTPLCSIAAQVRGEQVRVIDEFALENATVTDATEAFKNRYSEHIGPIFITGDASGFQRNVSNGMNAFGELRYALDRAGFRNYQFQTHSHNPSVLQRVKRVNAWLLNSAGESRLVIRDSCRELIKDLEEVLFKANEGVIDKARDPKRSHISDALGYLIWELFGDKPPIGGINHRLF